MSVPYATIDSVPRLATGLPLVARSQELSQLTEGLDTAGSGSPGGVLVAGDAGVGKSRLLTELANVARTAGWHVLVGRCISVGDSGLPYLPFREIVDQAATIDPGIVTDRPALGRLVSGGNPTSAGTPSRTESSRADDGQFGQIQLFDAVVDALSALSTQSPVLVEIEDLHWSDPSSRDLLSFLLSRLRDQRIFVVATYRADDLHRRHPLRPLLAELVRLQVVDRLDLAPLSVANTRELVTALGEGALPPDAVGDIAERAEGNAFFAEELVATAGTTDGHLPTALADLLLPRIEQLGPTVQRVLGAVSVTGRHSVRHDTLRAVVDLPEVELDSALRDAVQHHVLVVADGPYPAYTFRHALLREAVYADLLPGERVRLHAAYANLITHSGEDGKAAALAHHSLNSRDLPTALRASIAAAGEATDMWGLTAALGHLEQALELWHTVPDAAGITGTTELAVTLWAAGAAISSGHPERALAFARKAVDLADTGGDVETRAHSRRKLAEMLLANDRWWDAVTAIDEAWDLVRDLPPSSVRSWVLTVRCRAGADLRDEPGLAQLAVDDARASGTPDAEADALVALAFSQVREGDDELACHTLERALRLAVEHGALDVETRIRYNLVVTRYEQGKLDLAASIADDSTRRASEVGLTWSAYGLQLRWQRAMVHYARGDWDAAEIASEPPTQRVSNAVTALIAACRALITVNRGRFDEARADLDQVRARRYSDSQIDQLASVAETDLATWTGEFDAAAAAAEHGIAEIRKAFDEEYPVAGLRLATLAAGAMADGALHARMRRDTAAENRFVTRGLEFADLAEATLRHGVPRTAEMGPEGRAWAARAVAERGRLLAASDPTLWRAVIEAFGYGERYQQALARYRLAEALVAAGHREAATGELAAAAETAADLGAVPFADAIAALARRSRLKIADGSHVEKGILLTPREQSVLDLVAQGLTNRQVGERLFISDKTVSVHLTRIMHKLHAGSRTEAVARAYEQGLLSKA